jgi:hypothetical protein
VIELVEAEMTIDIISHIVIAYLEIEKRKNYGQRRGDPADGYVVNAVLVI